MRAFFGSLIAILLLALYVYLAYQGGMAVLCATATGCKAPLPAEFTAEMTAALSVVSGLVSALVITELSITQPGDAPVARAINPGASKTTTNLVKALAATYLLVWIAVGSWALLLGLKHAAILPAITNLGQAWFGLAIAAAYAYFGIRPPNPPA